MKSRISIEIDFENGNQPVIQILARTSDDVRDSLIQAFLQSLQHTSRWCKIEYLGESWNNSTEAPLYEEVRRWAIKPMTINEIPSEIKLMQSVIKK